MRRVHSKELLSVVALPMGDMTNLLGIVQMQDLASALIDLLVTLPRSSHCQSCIHMHVMARQVQTDESLE